MTTEPDSLFTKIIAGEIPSDTVYSDEHIVGFRDINPQAPVHVLFVPRRQIATINALEDDDAELVGRMVLAARRYAAEIGIAEDGFRLVMNCNTHGCQTVFHIHLHLLGGAQLAGGFGTPREA